MKKVLGILSVILLMSCSTDNNELVKEDETANRRDLVGGIEECIKLTTKGKGVPPPGLTLCECIEELTQVK